MLLISLNYSQETDRTQHEIPHCGIKVACASDWNEWETSILSHLTYNLQIIERCMMIE